MEARISGKAFRPLPIAAATWQIVGALLFAANGMVFAAALIFTPTATAYVIAASTPVYMLGYQLVWGEKRPSAAEYLIATVIFAGLLMFFLRGLQGGAAFGVGCAVAAGITFAGYFFAQGRLGKTVSSTGVPLAQVGAVDATAELGRLGLNEHLSSQRSNGLRAMVERIRKVAAEAA